MTHNVFKKGIELLMATFPDRQIIPEFYWAMIKDLTDKEYAKAINAICKGTKDLYPNTNLIALIRENAKELNAITAGEAWLEVEKQILSVGHYKKPKFSNPIIEKSTEIIGWRNICCSENIMVERAHFLKIFETLKQRENTNIVIGHTPLEIEDKPQSMIAQSVKDIIAG